LFAFNISQFQDKLRCCFWRSGN